MKNKKSQLIMKNKREEKKKGRTFSESICCGLLTFWCKARCYRCLEKKREPDLTSVSIIYFIVSSIIAEVSSICIFALAQGFTQLDVCCSKKKKNLKKKGKKKREKKFRKKEK